MFLSCLIIPIHQCCLSQEQYSTRRSKSHSVAIVLENDYKELEEKAESPKVIYFRLIKARSSLHLGVYLQAAIDFIN